MTAVKCKIVYHDDPFSPPSVLAYTTDRTIALTAARRCYDQHGYDDEADGPLTAGEPRLWRWVPTGPHSTSDYSRMLHLASRPGRGVFTAIEVRPAPEVSP